MAKAFFRPYESLAQMREILAAQVFQLPAFEQVPDSLLRVEIRSIAGKTLQMDPLGRTSSEKLLDDLGAVDGGAIPNHQKLARELAQQQA